MMRVSVVVADDHPIVLKGLLGLLSDESNVNIVAACSDGCAALDAIIANDPDIAILDVRMPAMTGTEVLASLRKMKLRTRVMLLTASASDSEILAAIAGGAKGIILKDMAADELIRCLSAIAHGGHWLPRNIVERALSADAAHPIASEEACKALTAREREISMLVASGLSNKEIADRLNVTDGTVKLHLHNVYQKTGVKNRTALAALALTCRDVFMLS